MKTLALLLASALLAAAAIAGITSTEAPTVYMILLPDNSIEKGKTWPTTEAECVARAKALIPSGSCSIRRTFTNVGTCADVAKPKWPLEKDADGFIIKPRFKDDGFKPGSDTEYLFQVEDFVPAPFPDCWVKGWRIAQDGDLNPIDDTPQVAVNFDDHSTWTDAEKADYAAFDAAWHSPEREAERHASCQCYADDKTPCPPIPGPNCPGASADLPRG